MRDYYLDAIDNLIEIDGAAVLSEPDSSSRLLSIYFHYVLYIQHYISTLFKMFS